MQVKVEVLVAYQMLQPRRTKRETKGTYLQAAEDSFHVRNQFAFYELIPDKISLCCTTWFGRGVSCEV